MNLSQFPRHPLTFPHPSPIHALPRLTTHLKSRNTLYAKREDSNSGLAFGGNKTRKLEYLIPDALAAKADTLISIGGIQSNQTRQVAAVAASLGLKCVLVQEDWVSYKDSKGVYARVGNIALSRVLGADVRLDAGGFDIGMRPSFQEALEEVEKKGGRPFAIPAGCSEHPKGGLGFVRFAEEVRAQEADMAVRFEVVVVCAVTGSTLAGMIVGFKQDKWRRVVGIDASAKPKRTREQVLRIARATAKLVELEEEIGDADVELDTRFGGPEYGVPTQGTLDAIQLCARQEGMLTDPVYEGKSMHGMIEMVKNGEFPEGANVLYVHLGGVPALSAYHDCFDP